MTTKTQQAVSAAVDATVHADDLNPAALDAFIATALERAERKQTQKRRGAKERVAFFTILPKALNRAKTVRQGVVTAVDVSFQLSEDSLGWFVQGLAQELYWTYRSLTSQVRRADQQAQALGESDDTSVAELAAELAGELGLDQLSGNDSSERTSYSSDDVESVLTCIHQALSDVYIHLADSGMATVPLLTRGSQVATTIDAANVLAEAIIDQGNQERKAQDREVLRDLAARV